MFVRKWKINSINEFMNHFENKIIVLEKLNKEYDVTIKRTDDGYEIESKYQGIVKENQKDAFDDFAIGEFPQDLDIINKKLTLMEELFGKISEAYQKVFGKSQKDLLVDFFGYEVQLANWLASKLTWEHRSYFWIKSYE